MNTFTIESRSKLCWRLGSLSLFLALCCISCISRADELLFSLTSLHVQDGKLNPGHKNQFNPGIGIRVGHITTGVYYNSDRNPSLFAVYSPFNGWFKPFAGATTGYKWPVYPAAGIAIEPWKTGPALTLTPMSVQGGGFVAALLWEQHIKDLW